MMHGQTQIKFSDTVSYSRRPQSYAAYSLKFDLQIVDVP